MSLSSSFHSLIKVLMSTVIKKKKQKHSRKVQKEEKQDALLNYQSDNLTPKVRTLYFCSQLLNNVWDPLAPEIAESSCLYLEEQ